ncbi:MAG TPA: class I SAM-dependent methyltransferase [Polyangiales bacterium]|nr:class I SAM-dependent methyltransferase [Polyangiales bacterium]
MSFYSEHIVPRCTDFMLSREPILKLRERVVQGMSGEVLEIGFGSGLNVPYYPEAVTRVYAVEPSSIARKLAEARVQHSRVPIVWSGLDGQRLELPDASIDAALTTFTLCTIPDVAAALRELRRVIKPGGMLHFLEHGRSPDSSVAKWQDRLTPLQKRLAAGCHLNRNTADLLRAAGFCLDSLDNYYLPGPRVATYISEGRARRC